MCPFSDHIENEHLNESNGCAYQEDHPREGKGEAASVDLILFESLNENEDLFECNGVLSFRNRPSSFKYKCKP